MQVFKLLLQHPGKCPRCGGEFSGGGLSGEEYVRGKCPSPTLETLAGQQLNVFTVILLYRSTSISSDIYVAMRYSK